MTIYTGCIKIIAQQPVKFLLFLKAHAEKLKPYFLISFESWLFNADSELYIYIYKYNLFFILFKFKRP